MPLAERNFRARFCPRTVAVRSGAWSLILLLIAQITVPSVAYGDGGPGQPEFSTFTPAGSSDLVDLFTGDFHYSIPLLKIDGYPVELNYNSGITMDQEASWVGLGWDLNVGSIQRTMRGLPDDFCGDEVTYENNMKSDVTVGVNVGAGSELFGIQFPSFGTGVTYNNYHGFDFTKSFSLNVKLKLIGGTSMTAGMDIQSGTKSGLALYPKLSVQADFDKCSKRNSNMDLCGTAGLSVGAGFSNRGGLTDISISPVLKFDPNCHAQASTGLLNTSFGLSPKVYVPSAANEFRNINISGTFKAGAAFIGLNVTGDVGGSYAEQSLREKRKVRNAYGYNYLDRGNSGGGSTAVLDFNREKDGAYSTDVAAISLAGLTPDVFAVSGQGAGGSYRLYRADIGNVFDPTSKSTGAGEDLSLELAAGNLAHDGGSVVVNDVLQTNGPWRDGNATANVYAFKHAHSGDLAENVYFIEANEPTLDPHPGRFGTLGGGNAVAMDLKTVSSFHVQPQAPFSGTMPVPVSELNRRPRAKLLSALTRAETRVLDPNSENGLFHSNSPDVANHFSSLTATADDGRRYSYGIPAYNVAEKQVTFAVDEEGEGWTRDSLFMQYPGSVSDLASNENGKDHYFQSTTLPPYAHSFLLTQVVSSDYRDLDNFPGPSINDVGDYVKFGYDKASGHFGWRSPNIPGQTRTARLDPGSLATRRDDKGNFAFGEKELWYLNTITTRDHVAVFITDERNDICSVDETGAAVEGVADTEKPQRLVQILLFTMDEYAHYMEDPGSAVPEQRIDFVYDYSLCVGSSICNGGGKLTLKGVYFTFARSDASAIAPYRFDYGSSFCDNPSYCASCVDRWGGLKGRHDDGSYWEENMSDGLDLSGYPASSFSRELPNSLYPYVDDIKPLADRYVQAWTLKAIDLPSGGRLAVDYESDEYGYVQDRPVMRMFPIEGLSCNADDAPSTPDLCGGEVNGSWADQRRVYFSLDPGHESLNDYVHVGDMVFFKAFMNVLGGSIAENYDHVPGYAKVRSCAKVADHLAYVELEPITSEDAFAESNPMFVAGLNYARGNFSDQVFTQPGAPDLGNMGVDLLAQIWSFVGSDLVSAVSSGLNPNVELANKGICSHFDKDRSWIRLFDPDKRRMGGGSRVKEIRMYDRWDGMTASLEPGTFYGQHYTYDTEVGECSGVASYEPSVGGDENVLHQPVFTDVEKLLAPDERSYQETPFGEMFYPAPGVGYSRVTVTPVGDASDPEIIKHGTGHRVHEFYTARDFPVITSRTDRLKVPQKNPFNVGSLLKFDSKDHMSVSQGFSIELNSMHGKPKRISDFASREPNAELPEEVAYRYTEYTYQCVPFGQRSYRLTNNAVALSADGSKTNAELGVVYDVITDMRESLSRSRSVGVLVNLEGFVIFIPLVVVPILPSFTSSETKFQSVAVTKVIKRFGLLDKVEQYDNGTKVITNNVAYDSETGRVILTSANDHFQQPVYSLHFPAYWGYDGMGPAYRNTGFSLTNVTCEDGVFHYPNAGRYFSVGDELFVRPGVGGDAYPPERSTAFVTDLEGDRVVVRHKDGSAVNEEEAIRLRVLSSGRKNMLDQDMATLTCMKDPLPNWGSDQYAGVIQASAIEYGQFWRTNCACIPPAMAEAAPFLTGVRGMWRPKRSWTYLTDRTWTRERGDVDIRNDGVFAEFSPFFALRNAKWTPDPRGWTFVDELLDVDPLGQPIESRNAIGIHSANIYGYGGKKNTATATNARYSDIGFVSFEDPASVASCSDNPFTIELGEATITGEQGHTGRHALLVPQNEHATINITALSPCSPVECDLQFTLERPKATELQADVSGGTAPYTITYEILAGAPSVSPTSQGVFASGVGAWKVSIHVCDAAQCCKNLILAPLP